MVNKDEYKSYGGLKQNLNKYHMILSNQFYKEKFNQNKEHSNENNNNNNNESQTYSYNADVCKNKKDKFKRVHRENKMTELFPSVVTHEISMNYQNTTLNSTTPIKDRK